MSNDKQKELLANLEQQREIAQMNFHRLDGAVNVLRAVLVEDVPVEAPTLSPTDTVPLVETQA